MTTPTHDLALARAERDAWQSTCEELHRAIAGRDVEIEAHLGRCEAADQRARSLEAALTMAQGSAVACADELRAIRDLVAPGNPQGTVVDAVRAMATGLIESIGARDAAEQARDMARDSRDAAIARAEAAERTLSGLYDDSKAELAKLRAELAELRMGYVDVCDAIAAETHGPAHAASIARETRQERDRLRAEVAELTVTRDRLLAREHEDGRLHAQLRADLAELRARPVLTVERLRQVLYTILDDRAVDKASDILAALGPVTLPSPDRAEELADTYLDEFHRKPGHHATYDHAVTMERHAAMRRALASLGAPPTSPTVAPPEVFAGASVEELVVQYLMAVDPGLDPGVARSMVSGPRRAGVAAVLARLKVTLVAPEFLRRIPLYTKHGPGGKGDPGICDAACVKCEAERIIARLTAGVPVTPERK